MNKKAAFELSTKAIVIIIIAIVFLLLALAVNKTFFAEAEIKIEQQSKSYAKPSIPIITSPVPSQNFKVFDVITFDAGESYDQQYKIVGYFWDFNSDFIIDGKGVSVDYSYVEPGEYNITLKVVNDQGAIGTTSQIVNIYTSNEKAVNIENSMFLVRDNDKNNWDTILKLIPATTWKDIQGLHTLPYYVYYVKDPSQTLQQSQIKEIMQKYGKKHAYVFDDRKMSDGCGVSCQHDLGDGYIIDVYTTGSFDDVYFNLWSIYYHVIIVDKESLDPNDHESAALIASLFAAFYNSPIIFIDNANLGSYQDYILNNGNTRSVYFIPSINSVDASVFAFISGTDRIAPLWYSKEELTDPNRRVNQIVELSSNVTMIT
ncbi:MAG: PKD domain-containing protein [Nanoarchaeota archaeon]